MAAHSFRVRFRFPKGEAIGAESALLDLPCPEPDRLLTLRSHGTDEPISKAREFILRGDSWPSNDDARDAGQRYTDALVLSLIRMGIGADFGTRAPRSAIFKAGLAMFEKQLGERVLQDQHGIMVFESDPPPRFASLGPVTPIVTRPIDRFTTYFAFAVDNPIDLNDRERLSIDLFNASFFETSIDARFLTLVMAVESLLDPAPRPDAARKHVDELIQLTKASGAITDTDRNSLLGSLRWLRNDSINQTGRKLATTKLGERRYMDLSAADFFSRCYDLRSRLVHGVTRRPDRNEVASATAEIQKFVSDLLSGPLLHIDA